MNTFIKHSLLLSLLLMATGIHANMVEFPENTAAMQAPQDIVALAQKTAERIDFTGGYEIAVPKKAGLIGWQRFAVGGTNPQTQNAFILVNPEWLKQMPEEQQMVLIARGMLLHSQGMVSPYGKYLTAFSFIVSMLGTILLFWLLGKTPIVWRNRGIRWLVAILLIAGSEYVILDPMLKKGQEYLGLQHDIAVSRMVADKLGDKESVIKALEFYDAAIKATVNNGETLFKPFEHRFADIANALKQ